MAPPKGRAGCGDLGGSDESAVAVVAVVAADAVVAVVAVVGVGVAVVAAAFVGSFLDADFLAVCFTLGSLFIVDPLNDFHANISSFFSFKNSKNRPN